MKRICITGGSQGIGLATAIQFAEAGYALFLVARNEQDLKTAKETIQSIHPQCQVHLCVSDLAIPEGREHAKTTIHTTWDSMDILVNNTGTYLPGQVLTEDDNQLEMMIRTNLYSAYFMSRNCIELLRCSSRGHIFNVCSIASLAAYPGGGSYSISKFALLGFSKALREELKQSQIQVTSILPGAVYTRSWSGSGVDPARIMQAEDIAMMIYSCTLLSPSACVEDIVLRPQLGDL